MQQKTETIKKSAFWGITIPTVVQDLAKYHKSLDTIGYSAGKDPCRPSLLPFLSDIYGA